MSAAEDAPDGGVPRVSRVSRVFLVDDHELVRSALASALSGRAGIQVVGEAANADEALTGVERERPDVLVMDIDMPGTHCFEAVLAMRERVPELRVIFLSAFFHDRYIEEALRVGAAGYVVKGRPLRMLFEALEIVAAGGDYFTDEVRARLVEERGSRRLDGAAATRASTLTPREVEVLRHLARGLSRKEIAQRMGLSPKTVETHVGGLMAKLDLHDRVELARYAIREGLAEA
jgi:DNA-binding NarL/FixJ family response regulator